ncbi:glycosyltransferase family 2 protein [Helicobacter sp. T3_23-1056]
MQDILNTQTTQTQANPNTQAIQSNTTQATITTPHAQAMQSTKTHAQATPQTLTTPQTQLVSIIIPIFNAQKFIAKALQSAINQSYENIEIICVDDASTDNSVGVAKEFADKDLRIKVLQNPQNLGTFATRNIGALNAKGEYLLFLDADDSLELNACEKIHNAIIAFSKDCGEQIDILAFNYAKRQSDSSNKSHILHPQNALFCIKDFMLWIAKRGVGKYWTLWGKAFLRSTYAKSLQNLDLGKRLLVAEDALNFVNVLFYAKNYACISDELYHYYENADSITQRSDVQKLHLALQNHRFVISTILVQSKHFSPFCQNLAKIFALELEITLQNEKRKMHKSSLFYVASSVYKKILRMKQKWILCKIKRLNSTNDNQ